MSLGKGISTESESRQVRVLALYFRGLKQSEIAEELEAEAELGASPTPMSTVTVDNIEVTE